MAKISAQGLSTFQSNLELLAKEVANINKQALYKASGHVADGVRAAIEAMPTASDNFFPNEKAKAYGPTESEKKQILANYGIAKFKHEGGNTYTKLGFSGYVSTPSKRFGNNVPTGMLMQCIEYGTPFRQATHTVTNAVKSLKDNVPKVIEDTITEEINKIMK